MQFSDVMTDVTFCKFAPDSTFFTCFNIKRLFIKESSVNASNLALVNLGFTPSDIIISPNSNLIAVSSKQKGIVQVYDQKGAIVAKIQDSQAGISGILWCADSIQLLVFSQLLFKCSIYNLQDKSISYIKQPKLGTSKGCVFSSNGKLMALLQRHDCKDSISIYCCSDWKLMNSIVLDSYDVIQILWDFNDSHIVAWENPINYRLHVVCPFKGVVLKYQPYDYALGIRIVQFSNRSLFLGVGSFDQKVRLLNAYTWKPICQLDCSSPTITSPLVKIYKEDDSVKGSSRLKTVDRAQYKIPILKSTNNEKTLPTQGISLLQFSYQDDYLACKNDSMPYTIWIWNVSTLQVQAIISLNSHIRSFKWSREDNTLCIISGTQKILFWKNGVILQCRFPTSENKKFNVHRFLWSNDNKRMLLIDKTDLIYSDLIPY